MAQLSAEVDRISAFLRLHASAGTTTIDLVHTRARPPARSTVC